MDFGDDNSTPVASKTCFRNDSGVLPAVEKTTFVPLSLPATVLEDTLNHRVCSAADELNEADEITMV